MESRSRWAGLSGFDSALSKSAAGTGLHLKSYIPKMHNTKQTLGVVAFTHTTIAKSEDVAEDVATKESRLFLKYLLTWCAAACMLLAR